jgi:hypothetical protein
MRRHFAVFAALLLGACVPQQRPSTAAPQTAAPTATAPTTIASADIGLPPPEGARRSDRTIARGAVGVRTSSALAIPPEAGERPERLKVAAVEPPKPSNAPPALPVTRPPTRPPTPPVTQAMTKADPAPPPSPPPPPAPALAERATSVQTGAAAPVEPPLAVPSGPTLTTILFAPRSADLSGGARLALEFFARDPATQRLRRIELWAWAGGDDPVEARKIAFACALAVHAYLIDLGVKARIEIGGFAETQDTSLNRVELASPKP